MPKRKLYLLLDPENPVPRHLKNLEQKEALQKLDGFLLGGSTLNQDFSAEYITIAQQLNIPIIGFPGNSEQVFKGLNAILFLHLLNPCNREALYIETLKACSKIENQQIKTLSTAYILVGDTHNSTTSKVTNAKAFGAENMRNFKDTLLYAQFSNFQNVYLESGSGASKTVENSFIKEAKATFKGTLWVGGGISNKKMALNLWQNGANNLVIGTASEKNEIDLSAIISARDQE